MPRYDYYCAENNRTIEVSHSADIELKTWGEVCYAAQITMGNTKFTAPVRRVIHPPCISTSIGASELKAAGFTKLVKRDEGVYENITAMDGEERYMKAGDISSIPHLYKKIRD
ncbi:MAG: hypothetical protein A2W28_08635 [Gammaproteobacteria bacterium RBG_16_51_14]|nr:MAG: hypothetical protein A2W28_08635 [Gammaproteobacteria bacterium RBG_16_51_14]